MTSQTQTQTQTAAVPFFINPESKSKQLWDAFVLLMTTAAAIEIPLRLVLGYPLQGAVLVFDIALIFVFTVDLILNFFTTEYVNGLLVTDRKAIALHYLKGWFLIDLLAAVPIDLLVGGWMMTLTDTARTFRLLRLFRLARIAQFMQRVARANIINVSVLRMIFLAFWIILLAHWTACGWAALGGGNIPIEEQGDKARLYLRCLYWAVTTIATIGYGDITPQTNYQTIFAMAIELIGAGLYGYVIGVVASLIANLDVARSQFLEKLEKINTFMRFRKIPNEIQDRIRNYYGYLWDSRRGYDESQVLTDLPASLKMQVSLYLNKDIIEKVPIFRGASEDLVQQIVMNLKPIVFTPGDFIFRQGEIGTSMFFISRGSVEVVSVDGRTVYATLTEGNFFGEIALLLSQPRNASIRALDYTDLYTLDKDTFQRILENFPDFLDHIREMAKKRQKEIQKEETQSPDTAPRGEVRPHRVPRLHAHRVGPSISLEWESARDANSYQLIRMDPASNRWKTICYSVIETRYLDDNPGPSELLSYRVRGLNQSGPGEWSEPVSTP